MTELLDAERLAIVKVAKNQRQRNSFCYDSSRVLQVIRDGACLSSEALSIPTLPCFILPGDLVMVRRGRRIKTYQVLNCAGDLELMNTINI